MLIARRNLMGGKPLPYDAEVEWIDSNGIGPIFNIPVEWDYVEVDFIANSGSNNDIVGDSTRSISSYLYIAIYANRFLTVNNYDFNTGSSLVGQRHKYALDQLDGSGYIDGENIGTMKTTRTGYGIGLLQSRSSGYKGNGRIFSCFAKKNGTVVFDAIPVKKNDIGCLYDHISKLVFQSSGTGSFICGPDKVSSILNA